MGQKHQAPHLTFKLKAPEVTLFMMKASIYRVENEVLADVLYDAVLLLHAVMTQ